ncbi:MAG: prepilin-type N-terminal cleavage/methylation domain-containing protein [Pseudomonadota bacterium]
MNRQRGFSLLELALVLVIVALLLGGLMTGVSGMRTRQLDADTRQQLDEITESLMTFAAINRRLPCPANPATPDTTAGAGIERTPNATGCTGGNHGVLPWATLGIAQVDSWGRRFTYRVTASFARTGAAITLTSVGDNTIRNAAGVDLATQVPVVIVSHGLNALRSYSRAGVIGATSPDASELENANADAVFVSDVVTDNRDDLVRWVPVSLLMSRMLQAGTLP